MALAVNRSIDIDFGISTQQTVLTGWNNFTGAVESEPTTTLNLVDVNGTATGIQMVPTWSFTGNDTGVAATTANYNGPYPHSLSGIPQSALRDSIYVQDGANLTLALTGLPANTSYNFLFYGAASNVGDYSLFTVTGSTVAQASLTPLVNNSTKIATIVGIEPDAMQKIAIRFAGRRADGGAQDPNVNDDARGRLNFMQITQFTPPMLMAGDYNNDSMVNAADYSVWRANFGSAVNLAADGNRNGFVDAADYAMWRNAMAAASGSALVASLQLVPEPASMMLIVLGVCGYCATSRPRRPIGGR